MPLQSIDDLLKKQGEFISKTEEAYEKKIKEIRTDEKESQVKIKATSLGVSYINLKGFPIAPETLKLLPKDKLIYVH